MMRFSNSFCAVFIFYGILNVQANKRPKEACSALMTESVTKITCTPVLNEFFGNIQSCRKLHPGKLTCKFAECVVYQRYHLRGEGNDSISFTKAHALLKRLTKEQPGTKEMNNMIDDCCICNDNFLTYPELVPNCKILQYMTCAVFSYLIAQDTASSSYERHKRGCSQIATDVSTCRPALKEFCPGLNK